MHERGRSTRAGRLAVGLALVLSAAALPAWADHVREPSCMLFQDDERQLVEQLDPRPSHDVRGGALGSDDRILTAVIHLGALPSSTAAEEAALAHSFFFRVGKDQLFLTVPARAGAPASYGVLLPGLRVVLGEPEVVRDEESRELRITAPLAGFDPLADVRAGEPATGLVTWTEHAVNTPESSTPLLILDVAKGGDRHYTLGEPSCVRVGG